MLVGRSSRYCRQHCYARCDNVWLDARGQERSAWPNTSAAESGDLFFRFIPGIVQLADESIIWSGTPCGPHTDAVLSSWHISDPVVVRPPVVAIVTRAYDCEKVWICDCEVIDASR